MRACLRNAFGRYEHAACNAYVPCSAMKSYSMVIFSTIAATYCAWTHTKHNTQQQVSKLMQLQPC